MTTTKLPLVGWLKFFNWIELNLRATAVTRVLRIPKWEHRTLALEKNILPPLLPGLETETFWSQVRCFTTEPSPVFPVTITLVVLPAGRQNLMTWLTKTRSVMKTVWYSQWNRIWCRLLSLMWNTKRKLYRPILPTVAPTLGLWAREQY